MCHDTVRVSYQQKVWLRRKNLEHHSISDQELIGVMVILIGEVPALIVTLGEFRRKRRIFTTEQGKAACRCERCDSSGARTRAYSPWSIWRVFQARPPSRGGDKERHHRPPAVEVKATLPLLRAKEKIIKMKNTTLPPTTCRATWTTYWAR